jgi:hypothetical protein
VVDDGGLDTVRGDLLFKEPLAAGLDVGVGIGFKFREELLENRVFIRFHLKEL